MQGERPEEIIDWSADKARRRVWKEIRSLYTWWTKTRPARQSLLDN